MTSARLFVRIVIASAFIFAMIEGQTLRRRRIQRQQNLVQDQQEPFELEKQLLLSVGPFFPMRRLPSN